MCTTYTLYVLRDVKKKIVVVVMPLITFYSTTLMTLSKVCSFLWAPDQNQSISRRLEKIFKSPNHRHHHPQYHSTFFCFIRVNSWCEKKKCLSSSFIHFIWTSTYNILNGYINEKTITTITHWQRRLAHI